MNKNALGEALGLLCARQLGGAAHIDNLQRLSGGANMESWKFTHARQDYVLRRMPEGLAESATSDPNIASALSLETQAQLIEYAHSKGIKAPGIAFRLSASDALGDGFVMRHVAGETLPQRILNKDDFAKARKNLVQDCAQQLAKIHALDAAAFAELEHATPAESVAALKQRSIAAQCNSDICEFAFWWLENHAPEPVPPRLLHGDFRMGNLMVDENGLAAVLDWELANLGDPVQDIAYFCTPSWRFGHYSKTAGGLDKADIWISAYEKAAGISVNRSRFQWWLIYNTLWWGVVCASMAQMWREGSDRSLERAVIGRRVSEVEVDLVLLLEDASRAPLKGLTAKELRYLETPPYPEAPGTQDHETLQALTEWFATQQKPEDKHGRFEHKVAMNALSMAERSAKLRGWYNDHQQNRLHDMQLSDRRLGPDSFAAMSANNGQFWHHLRLTAMENCLIDQPHYAGLKAAQEKWISQ